MRHRDAMIRLFSELVGRRPDHTGGVTVWWDVVAGGEAARR
ncbi:MAG TPA: hypothetical protein VM142_10485 [Acidimicrobiales bacterium]|nr:hypothetical protein [Acidimicrobiales bacterium]